MKRYTSILLTIALLCLMLVPGASAASYTDTANHWARDAIERWSDMGIVQGFEGNFRPDDTITKAELSAVLNRILRMPTPARNYMKDISPGDWYYNDITALAGYSCYRDNDLYAEPNTPMTRQEAAYIVIRAIRILVEPNLVHKPDYTDMDAVESWAKNAVSLMSYYGYMKGFPDGTFKPERKITRAEFITMLNNIFTKVITEPGVYDTPVNGNIVVSAPDVELIGQDTHGIIITPGIGSGTVKLTNCKSKYIAYVDLAVREQVIMDDYSEQNITLNPYNNAYRAYIDTFFPEGLGTEKNPYHIRTVEQLGRIDINPDSPGGYGTRYYVLDNDIALAGKWTPIGMNGQLFIGVLDGQGYSITGMSVELDAKAFTSPGYTGTVTTRPYAAGLFAQTGNGSVIKNLNVEGTIKLDNTLRSDTNTVAGGIVGHSGYKAVIENCTADVIVTVNSIGEANAGGIAGSAEYSGTIDGCDVSAKVSAYGGTESCAGGAVGYTYYGVNITNTATKGSVYAKAAGTGNTEVSSAGGICGTISISGVENCNSSANVSAAGGYYSFAGGLVGVATHTNRPDAQPSELFTSYATGDVNAADALMQNNAGGAIGQATAALVKGSWSSGNVSASGDPGYFNAAGGFAGSCYDNGTIENCYSTGGISVPSNMVDSSGGFVGRLAGEIKNCYATGSVTISGAQSSGYGDFAAVGSIRGNARVTACFDLMNNAQRGYPLCIGLDNGKEQLEQISNADAKSADTYTARGWDFDEVWIMPSSGYTLPILRGVNEQLQEQQSVPSHLS